MFNYCAIDRLRIYLQTIDCILKRPMRRDVFQAIADPTRRAILGLLALQAMTPNALAEHFNTSRQAVSNHIKILSECSLVKQEQAGREIYYHFNPGKMKEVDNWLAPFRKLWNSRFDQLDELLQSVETKSKKRKS